MTITITMSPAVTAHHHRLYQHTITGCNSTAGCIRAPIPAVSAHHHRLYQHTNTGCISTPTPAVSAHHATPAVSAHPTGGPVRPSPVIVITGWYTAHDDHHHRCRRGRLYCHRHEHQYPQAFLASVFGSLPFFLALQCRTPPARRTIQMPHGRRQIQPSLTPKRLILDEDAADLEAKKPQELERGSLLGSMQCGS